MINWSGTKTGRVQPAIRNLLKNINVCQHKIGLHPSFQTYRNPEQLKLEAARLRSVCNSLEIEQAQWGRRMHFLRWSHPETIVAWTGRSSAVALATNIRYTM